MVVSDRCVVAVRGAKANGQKQQQKTSGNHKFRLPRMMRVWINSARLAQLAHTHNIRNNQKRWTNLRIEPMSTPHLAPVFAVPSGFILCFVLLQFGSEVVSAVADRRDQTLQLF